MICGEVYYEGMPDNPLAVAACTQRYGLEHSHSDHTGSEAIAAGLARRLTDTDELFCADARHATPCPGPCSTCWDEGCAPTIVGEAIEAHFGPAS